MSPPTEADHAAALAALAGQDPAGAEADELAAAATRLSMISMAQQRGSSWAQIALATGAPSGAVAKRDAKRLARRVQAALIAADAAAAVDDDLGDAGPRYDPETMSGGWIEDLALDQFRTGRRPRPSGRG